MASVFDVATYVIELYGERNQLPITTWKLQKLVYYCQAWSTVWDDAEIFDEPIQAWANGPVCPVLYVAHKGSFKLSSLAKGQSATLSQEQKETVRIVFEHYGGRTAQYLSDLTHMETPWKEARACLALGDRGSNVITLESMAEYYGGFDIKTASCQGLFAEQVDDESDDEFLADLGVFDKMLTQVSNCLPNKNWEAELNEL